MTKATGLKLIMGDDRKRVMRPSCTIKLGDTTDKFSDFVTVGHNMETGATTLLHNTDPLTLGHALMLINNAFETTLATLTTAQQAEVMASLRA